MKPQGEIEAGEKVVSPIENKKKWQWGTAGGGRRKIEHITGVPVGDKYKNILHEDKKLSIGDMLSRASRDAVVQPSGNFKRPPVGHYRPKHVQVQSRTQTYKFSSVPRKL